MSQKRKAAADVFKEQNVMVYQQAEGEAAPIGVVSASAPGSAPQRTMAMPSPAAPRDQFIIEGMKSSEELQLEKEPIRVRENGFWIWKRVIIPPNAYVVHTRLGRPTPVTVGLGKSFRYNPFSDAYLVVPAAMQTIGVVANCISREKQGINILAYVQWQIDDFSVAYRKLDFSDSREPLGIVNAQLREQAEAAIKDKISTMSVEEVLTDKKPIIAELTTRLKEVAERQASDGSDDEGLGIKIVTVQIREAIVSSQRLWQDLQAPFRHEQETKARISYLSMEDDISRKELETKQATETREAETMLEIERIKQSKQTEATNLRLAEETARFTKEQETLQEKIQQEEKTDMARRDSQQRLAAQTAQIEHTGQLEALQRQQEQRLEEAQRATETERRKKTLQVDQDVHALEEGNRLAEQQTQAEQQRLDYQRAIQEQAAAVKAAQQEQADLLERQILEARLAREQATHEGQLKQEEEKHQLKIVLLEKEVEVERLRQEVRNLANERDLAARLIDKLPELAAQMPEIQELRVLQTGHGDPTFDALASFLSRAMALGESLGVSLKKGGDNGASSNA